MNFENICRTCLRIPKQPKNLFSDSGLLHKIQIISSVEIENNNELPTQICEDCYNNINHFYNFRKVIINSENDLKTRLETLKKTNYTSKPRGKLKHYEAESDNNSEIYIDVKTEPDLNDDAGFSDKDYISEEEDSEIRRAILMRKLFKCKECKQIFNSKIKLYNHNRTQHTAPGICNICGTVVRADNLKKHIRLHSEGPCSCEECGRVFKNSESLRSHKFTHMDQAYTCEICGKTFKMRGEHTRHMKKHSDPDSLRSTCSVCGKKVGKLKEHMRSHTGEKPYACNYCNKGFSSSQARKLHIRLHTNEKPYVCGYCESSFPQKVSLVTHLKTKHGIILK